MLASNGAAAGVMRTPAAGSPDDPALRIVILADSDIPAFARSLNGPLKVAPGASSMTSPGFAASIAAWRLPPAATLMVAAALVRGSKRARATHSPTGTIRFKATPLMCRGTIRIRGNFAASRVSNENTPVLVHTAPRCRTATPPVTVLFRTNYTVGPFHTEFSTALKYGRVVNTN